MSAFINKYKVFEAERKPKTQKRSSSQLGQIDQCLIDGKPILMAISA